MRNILSLAKKRGCNSDQIFISVGLALLLSLILRAITVHHQFESSNLNIPSIRFNINDGNPESGDGFDKEDIQVGTRAKEAIPHSSKPIPTILDESKKNGGVQQTLERENKSLKSSLDNNMTSSYSSESSIVVTHGAASMHDSEVPRLPTRKYTCIGTFGPMTYPEVPGFIIAGAQKSGTSALRHILASHPDIITNRRLEAHYFDTENFSEIKKYSPDLRGKLDTIYKPEWLCDLGYSYITNNLKFNETHNLTGRMSFEKTPVYMVHHHLPELISLVCPWKPKIIIILRNPVDRAYSAYDMMRVRRNHTKIFMKKIQADVRRLRAHGILINGTHPRKVPNPQWLKHNHTYKPFKMASNVLLRGFYANQIEPWLEHFPLGEKLLILQYEEFKNNNAAVVGKVLKFLGLPQMNFTTKQLNTNYSPVNTTLIRKADIAVDFLEDFYNPYNDMLADLLGEEWRNVWERPLTSDESKKDGGAQNISYMDSDLTKSVSDTDIRSGVDKEDVDADMIAKEAILHSSIYHG